MIQVIFDNGGGTTLQTEQGVYYYSDGVDAAEDMQTYITDATDDGWDSADDDCRIEPSDEEIANGVYKVYDLEDVKKQIASGEIDSAWRNVRDFFVGLGCSDVS